MTSPKNWDKLQDWQKQKVNDYILKLLGQEFDVKADNLHDANIIGIVCQQCGERFVPTGKRGSLPKFCSNACKQKNYYNRRK